MIERSEFGRAWKHLCERFGRANDPQQAAAYFGFLSEAMDNEEFTRAARTLWATARFFPRPADFLVVAANKEWLKVLQAVELYTPPQAEWLEPWRSLTPRARQACDRLGGIAGMRQIFDKDVLRLKEAWEKSYEQTSANEVLALAAPSRPLIGAAS